MVEFDPLARDLGQMLQALSLMMGVSVVVAFVWGEFYAVPALLLSGGSLRYRKRSHQLLRRRDEAEYARRCSPPTRPSPSSPSVGRRTT
jgi:hypothetical protein